jgi:hypothetical protein
MMRLTLLAGRNNYVLNLNLERSPGEHRAGVFAFPASEFFPARNAGSGRTPVADISTSFDSRARSVAAG